MPSAAANELYTDTSSSEASGPESERDSVPRIATHMPSGRYWKYQLVDECKQQLRDLENKSRYLVSGRDFLWSDPLPV